MKLRNLFVMLTLMVAFGSINTFAQSSSKAKAKTSKVHKVKKSSTSDGDYYNGHKIYTGPRGGRYYINSNGKKTYI